MKKLISACVIIALAFSAIESRVLSTVVDGEDVGRCARPDPFQRALERLDPRFEEVADRVRLRGW